MTPNEQTKHMQHQVGTNLHQDDVLVNQDHDEVCQEYHSHESDIMNGEVTEE